MRQAGRYMEEYRRLRERYTFMEMCQTPELALEVTLQPIRRFDLDAAIIFSDILLPLEKMGVAVHFGDAGGPALEKPVRSRRDVEALRPVEPEEEMSYVLKAVEMVRQELAGAAPLIGFSGAPFTLASYLIEGGGSKHFLSTKAFMYGEPDAFNLLMEKLTVMAASYLNAQIRHGAQAVQIFDSWAGVLSAPDYEHYIMGHMTRLFASLDRSVPSIHFGADTCHLLPLMKEAGGDVIGVDWRLPINDAWELIGRDRAIQGNLDPAALFSPAGRLTRQAGEVLRRAAGAPGHIFNLGHGVLPGTPVEAVELLVRTVHEYGGTP
jgi:uroporphyrinogen decarboxylase